MAGDVAVNGSSPFTVDDVIPKKLGPKVREATQAADRRSRRTNGSVVRLRAGDGCADVCPELFATLRRRFPNAEWRLSAGPAPWSKPVVLLSTGMWSGGLTAVLMPTCLEPEGSAGKMPTELRRTRRGKDWWYVPIQGDEE